MTPSDVLSRVRNQLVEETASFWTDAELYRYMTDAEHEINLQTECHIVSTAATTVTSTSAYTLPSDCLAVTRVTFDGVPLRRIDQHQRERDALDMPGYGGSLVEGNPTHYYQVNSTVTLWPIPSRAATVRYTYLADPPAITTASSAFTIPANYHTSIPPYVLRMAYLKDQDEGRSETFKREYEESVMAARVREKSRRWAGGFPVVRDDSGYMTYGGLT